MTVVLNEGAIELFFHNPSSRLGLHLQRKAKEVERYARLARPPQVRSGDLLAGLEVRGPFQDPDAQYYLVGTDAAHPWKGHEDFNYPIALELGGVTPQGMPYHYPFLVPALKAAGFRQVG